MVFDNPVGAGDFDSAGFEMGGFTLETGFETPGNEDPASFGFDAADIVRLLPCSPADGGASNAFGFPPAGGSAFGTDAAGRAFLGAEEAGRAFFAAGADELTAVFLTAVAPPLPGAVAPTARSP